MSMLVDTDPAPYSVERGYAFPFVLMDPSLGRIEWMFESKFHGRDFVEILLSARQTRDERYAGKLFRIRCRAPRIMTYDIGNRGPKNFFAGVAWVEYCLEHKAVGLVAYPPDGATKLSVEPYSSVAGMLWWE